MRATLLILAGLAAAACGAIAAPAGFASAAESAIVTIGTLEAQGFDVKIDRIGSAPLSECVVTHVRKRTPFGVHRHPNPKSKGPNRTPSDWRTWRP